jgi:hypothetical protein
MELIIIAVLVAWLPLALVVIGLCVAAARGDGARLLADEAPPHSRFQRSGAASAARL